MKLILTIVLLAFVTVCFSQYQYIGMHRFFVKKVWKSYTRKDKLNFLTTSTDTTITFSIRDTTVRDMDMIFYFNKEGKCNKVKEIFDCDSCFQLIFNKVLNDPRFGWNKILEGVYISKYSKKLLLLKNPNAPFSYILQHNKYMTKEEYNSFLPKENSNAKKLSQN